MTPICTPLWKKVIDCLNCLHLRWTRQPRLEKATLLPALRGVTSFVTSRMGVSFGPGTRDIVISKQRWWLYFSNIHVFRLPCMDNAHTKVNVCYALSKCDLVINRCDGCTSGTKVVILEAFCTTLFPLHTKYKISFTFRQTFRWASDKTRQKMLLKRLSGQRWRKEKNCENYSENIFKKLIEFTKCLFEVINHL